MAIFGSNLTTQAVQQQEVILDARQAQSVALQTGAQVRKAQASDDQIRSDTRVKVWEKQQDRLLNAAKTVDKLYKKQNQLIQGA